MFYSSGWLHVICGCMFCGKTDEMLRLLRRFSIAGRRVVLIKPRLDTRTDALTVVSRSGAEHTALSVEDSSGIQKLVGEGISWPSRKGSSLTRACPRWSAAWPMSASRSW
jgi:thymidine kinase